MGYPQESELNYIDDFEDDIPVTGFDIDRNWDGEDKLNAAIAAESKLEADVNEGRTIQNPHQIHGEAAAAWATYKLVLGMKSPDSATRGDALDEGSERMAFAREVKSMYMEYKRSINEAEDFESAQDRDSADFFVANWQ